VNPDPPVRVGPFAPLIVLLVNAGHLPFVRAGTPSSR
jgi:hypothetical protein